MRRKSEREIRKAHLASLAYGILFILLGTAIFLLPASSSPVLYEDLSVSDTAVRTLHRELTVRGISLRLTAEDGASYILTGKYDESTLSAALQPGVPVTIRFYRDSFGRWFGWRYAGEVSAGDSVLVKYAYSPVIGSLWRNILATLVLSIGVLILWFGRDSVNRMRRQEAQRDRRIERKYGSVRRGNKTP
ncbi:MAG: hypothetical protein IJU18_03440 [Oscillospiraceae bacterium]|nr:hypothetical protein [Oscillospiraceae bacterium]